MAVKQYFISAELADQIIAVDATEGQKVKATLPGDYVAIAGVQADRVSRVFDEADPNDPNLPLFDVASGLDISPDPDENGYLHPGWDITVDDAALTCAATRQSVAYWIIDPTSPNTILASSSAETWRDLPDTSSSGSRSLEIEVVYKDKYSARTLTVRASYPIMTTSGNLAPQFSTAPAISSAGTAVGATATIAPPTVTGTPTPTIEYQVFKDGVASGDPFSGNTFVMSDADTIYSVQAKATNTAGDALSEMSNAITTDMPTVTAPAWTESWASMEELQTAGDEGKVRITISGATLDPDFDYFVFTSEVVATSVTAVRQYGERITSGSQVVTRNPKATGLTILPRIVAVDKTLITDSEAGIFVLSRLGYANGYTITGIIATSTTAIRALDVPVPDTVTVNEAIRRFRFGEASNGATSDIRMFQILFNSNSTFTNRPMDKHALVIMAQAAYCGDTTCQGYILAQLAFWRTQRYSNSFASAWTGCDPMPEGGYQGNYAFAWMAVCLLALNTPAIRDALPPEGILALGAYIEACYVVQIYAQSHKVSATSSDNSDSRVTMLGNSFAWTLGSEPNISVNNFLMLVMGHAFLQTEYGKDYLTARGFTSISDLWSKWTKSGFADFLNSPTMKNGQVSTGTRACDNLYRMFAQNTAPGVGKFTRTPPSNATIRAAWRMGAGPTNWRSSYGHSLADLENMIVHALFRAAGCEGGSASVPNTERSGENKDLLVMSNPNKTTNPPTGRGGPRCSFWGYRWYWGFACKSAVAPVVAAAGSIQGVAWSGNGTEPDFKRGVPQLRDASAGYGSSFAYRRGYAMTTTYSPCPFEGVPGVISEMHTHDDGSFHRLTATTKSSGGERSSTSYSAFTIGAIQYLFGSLAALQQGPLNLLAAGIANMTSGWSSGDAGWTSANAPSTAWGASKIYSYGYTTGQTGNSGELITTSFAVRDATHAFMVRLQMASGVGNATVAVRFLNASGAQVGSDVTIYSGAVTTTVVDKDKLIARPSGATRALIVVKVNKGSTTGVLRVGGVAVRFAPRALFDWDNALVKEALERMRRALIHWRFAIMNGWYDITKMCILLSGMPYSDSGDRTWANDKDGERAYFLVIAPMINTYIPWWRKNITGFPAINTGFTGWNWENPVTMAANGGLSAKT